MGWSWTSERVGTPTSQVLRRHALLLLLLLHRVVRHSDPGRDIRPHHGVVAAICHANAWRQKVASKSNESNSWRRRRRHETMAIASKPQAWLLKTLLVLWIWWWCEVAVIIVLLVLV